MFRSARSGFDVPHAFAVIADRVLIENGELVADAVTNSWHFDESERIHVSRREPLAGAFTQYDPLHYVAIGRYLASFA
jgi:hypothetical protein